MARHWLTVDRDLRIRRLLKLTSFRLTIEGSRGVLWLIRASTQGVPELTKEAISLLELGSLLVVKVAPKLKSGITKVQDRIDVTFSRIDSILKDLSITLGAMPYGGRFFDGDESAADTAIATASVDDPITNIREATKGRHIIILGDTGTGKTTTAQYIAVENSISTEVLVRVYDCEGMFKCLPGWQHIGLGENFDAINTAMKEDLDNLSHFFASGQPEAKEPTHIYIGEEYPDIVDQCEHSSKWIDRHARRGRKAGRFLILLSQYDQIKAFGLEGKSSLLKNLRIIRLGEFAIAHAKHLKNPALVRWLEQSMSHCLINDSPLQLPSYEEMTRIIGQCRMNPGHFANHSPALLPNSYQTNNGLPKIDLEATENQGFQTPEGLQTQILAPQKSGWESQWEEKFWQVWQAIQNGKSNYWIGQNIFDCSGGTSYQRLCERLDEIR